ncbi:MAG: helix-turn-helix domain-containing protein, partial [Chloroflexi bacterium]|nr:helix-turn-helix domain-containing protein [Chloroflexota bacterium]
MDYYERHGRNAALTCRYFGISRQTFYRWRRRYRPRRLASLEERSCRPRRVLQPTWSLELAQAVCELREQYPRLGGKTSSRRSSGRPAGRSPRRWWAASSPSSGNGVCWWSHRERSWLSASPGLLAPTPYSNPRTTAPASQETSSRWTRSACGPYQASSSSTSPPATWSPAGMSSRCTPGPPPRPPPPSWMPSRRACPSQCGRSRWMGDRSSRRSSSAPV